MELLLYAALFTLWQGTVALSAHATALVSFASRCRAWRGPGRRLLSPWPGDYGLLLQGPDPDRLPARIEQDFSLADFCAELDDARRDTRLLRGCCELYLLLVFAALPVALLRLSAEAAWSLVLPAIAVVHVVSLGALQFAERRRRLPGRVERWIGAALYPPALLRTPVELLSARVARFHPATAAAALLDDEGFVRLLRRELGALRWSQAQAPREPGRESGGEDAYEGLREKLLSLCEQRGVDRGLVLSPRRAHPRAASYCPSCLDEFRVEQGTCRGCGRTSIAYS